MIKKSAHRHTTSTGQQSTRRALRFLAVIIAALVLNGRGPDGPTISAQGRTGCAAAVNPIACENVLAGVVDEDWFGTPDDPGDTTIQGFATEMSVNFGGTVDFKINTDSTNYRIDIYRLGYYNGAGVRKVDTIQRSTAQRQPACFTDADTGLYDCGNWEISASWPIPDSAVSGIYIAKLTREDVPPPADGLRPFSHIYFIVRDDARAADVLFQTSDTTWQAYNTWPGLGSGGSSTYCGGPVSNAGTAYFSEQCPGRAAKVSYNRPFDTRFNGNSQSFLFNAEVPMVRWLEANGYDTKYWSGIDTDRHGAQLTGANKPKVFLSVGHDEYWSGAQRSAVEGARDAGVNLAFLSGNEVYWKTRWEASNASGTTQSHRTLVTYKETLAGAKIDPAIDPVTNIPISTGTWRDLRFRAPDFDGGRPENALIGQIWTVNSGTAAIQVPASMAGFRLWQNTRVAALSGVQVATLGSETLGYEWGEPLENGFEPAGVMRLSSTTVNDVEKIVDYGATVGQGTATHSLTLYRHNSGALVFGAGTVQWSWGLDDVHDRGTENITDQAMQQATVTLFADMGVQPDTLQAGADPARPLQTVTASTDAVAPSSTIAAPAAGAKVETGERITISGSAADTDGIVAGVEVSVDNGTTWKRAQGTTAWTFAWAAGALGEVTILTRAVDDSGNLEIAGAGRTVTVVSEECPCPHLFKASALPENPNYPDSSAYELGVKFRSDIRGFIKGVRYYKSVDNTGTHLGNLWSGDGQLLATATFENESASGWQEVLFATPVEIQPNTIYVASYHTNVGHYAITPGYFTDVGTHSPPLHAPTTGESGGNGVFAAGGSAFPSGTFNGTNYWVDVVFSPSNLDEEAPIISNVKVATVDSAKAQVRWKTNESATSRVEYSTDAAFPTAATRSVSSATFKTSHFLTLNGLTANTTYYLRLTSVDGPGNSTTFTPASITLPGPTLRDTAETDFGGGAGTGTYVSGSDDGELILTPTVGTEFNGTSMPAGWLSIPWGFGGFATVANGVLKVDGSRVGTCVGTPCGEAGAAVYGPGRSLEFVATFTGDAFQHAGLGVTLASTSEPWAMFSTATGGNLFARTNTGGVARDMFLGGTYLGAPHRYRIEWRADNTIRYFIDDVLVAPLPHHNVEDLQVAGPMRPVAASDFSVFGGTVVIDWVRMTPHTLSGEFVSRVFDANAAVDWRGIDWVAKTPTGTTLDISVRTGDTATPDASWTEFAPVLRPGQLNLRSRYIQYGAVLSTNDPSRTPALEDIIITTGHPPVAYPDPGTVTAFDVTGTSLTFPATGPGSLIANDTDVDGDVLRVVAVTPGKAVLNEDGSVTYTRPAGSFSGLDTFSYMVSDGLLTSSATVRLNVIVEGGSTPPPAPVSNDDRFNVVVNETTVVAAPGVLANDEHGVTARLFIDPTTGESNPANGTLVFNTDGSFTYTSTSSVLVADTFKYIAIGADGAEGDVATVTLNRVEAVSAPAEVGGTVSTGDVVSVGDPLQSAVTTPVGANVSITQGVISADAELPETGFALLNRQIDISITDSNGVSLSATPAEPFSLSFLLHKSLVPEAQPGQTFEDVVATLTVLRNGNPMPECLGETSITDTVNGNPCLSARLIGADSVEFTVLTTNASFWHVAAMGLVKSAQNDGPFETPFQTPLTQLAPGVLGNDFGGKGMTASLSQTPPPFGGSVNLSAEGGFTFTPDAGFCGTASFAYTAHRNGLTSNGTVSIIVHCNPEAADDTVTVREDSAATAIAVLANDDENATLTIDSVTQPTNGTASIDGAVVKYLPTANFFGDDTFTYTVTDSRGGVGTGTVDVTVTPVNDAPSFTSGGNHTVLEDAAAQSIAGWAGNLSAGAGQESDQSLSFVVSNDNNTLFASQPAILPNGTLQYTPAPNAHGSALVTARIQDNGGTADGGVDTSDPQTFLITVASVVDAPKVTVVGGSFPYDGASHAATATAAGTDGNAVAGTFTFTYTPGGGQAPVDAGTYQVEATFTSTDPNYSNSKGTGAITITPVAQTITFGVLANKTYDDAPFAVTATASSGLPVSFSIVSGPASVSGNTVTITGTGTVIVRASQAGNANYDPATAVDRSFTVGAASQTITFDVLGNKTYGDAPFALTATASSGLPVSFSIVSGPASVSGDILTITGTGEVVVRASQAGNATYGAAPAVDRSFTVAAASQTITFGVLGNKTYGDAAFDLSATASSGLAVSFSIVSGPASVSGNTVTLTGVGAVVVRASQTGNANYGAAPDVDRTFTVGAASQTITFGVLGNKTYDDAAFDLSATASSGLPVSFSIVSGPASVSGNTVTLTGVGAVVVRASQAGNANYDAAPDVDRTFTVGVASQTITFGVLGSKTYGDSPFAVTATASSGLPVSFSIVSGPASVSGNTVTISGVGEVIVRASQAGNANYDAATPVDRTFTVGVASQTITFGVLGNKTYGDAPFAVTATASSGLPVSFSIVSGPASVSGNMVTLTGTGTVVVRASQAGNANYDAAAAVDRSFTVGAASQTITFGVLGNKTYGDAPFALTATASSGLPVSFSIVSGPASVSGDILTITGTGEVVVRASQAGNATYGAATAVDRSFTVGVASQTITFGVLANKTYGDAPFALTATASSGLPVSFSIVSGPASVSGNTVTITGTGAVVVRASQAGNANYDAATAVERTFTVGVASQTITFGVLGNKTYGDAPFAVTATASSGLPVSFSIVSGPASVSGNTVTITGTGAVVVRASQAGNANYDAATAVERTFTVGVASQTITFGVLGNKTYGDAPFAVSATASSGLPVSFSIVSGPASVSGNTVTISGVGEVIVRASQAGNANYDAATAVDRSFTVGAASQTITFGVLGNKTYGDAPFAVTATASSGLPVSFSIVSGPASVSGNTVTLTGTGTVVVRASQAGNANYGAATAVDRSFTVGAASQTITFGVLGNKTYGDAPFAVTATASSGLPVSFSIVSGPASVSGNTLTITGVGEVIVRASQAGNANYNAATPVDRTFTVGVGSQTITFGVLANKTYGDAPFTVTATASSGLPVSFSIVSGPASVSGNTVTITGVGAVTVRASQAGTANYNAATPVDRTFTVGVGSQTITFGVLANKTYGDAPFTVTATASSGLPVSFSIVSGPASVAGNTVTITGTGAVVVRASQAGNANYDAATPVDRSFTVGVASQTITFGVLANKAYGDAPFAVTATASSGLPVSFSIVSGPASVSGNMVTLTGTGTVVVRASQAGNATYDAATAVDRSFTVHKATPAITWNNPTAITYGTALSAVQLNATSSVSGTFTYSPVAGAMLNAGNGQSLSVTLAPADSVNYNSASKSVTIDVLKANQTITFGALANKTSSDAPFAVNATASSGLAVVFSIVSGPATIAGNTVTLTGTAGTVVVRASQVGNTNYNAATAVDQSFTVTAPVATTPTTTSIPTASLLTAAYGTNITFTSTVTSTGGTPTGLVEFFDGTVSLGTAPLNAAGTASKTTNAVASGTRSITAKYLGDSKFAGSTSGVRTVTVTGTTTVTTTFTASPLSQQYSDRMTFSATVTPGTVGGRVVAKSARFKFGTQVIDTVPLTLNAAGNLEVTLNAQLLDTTVGALRPGTKLVTVEFLDNEPSVNVPTKSASLGVKAEDALTEYTGPSEIFTTSGAATIRLEAKVWEVADGNLGDITRATVTFVNRTTGAVIGTGVLDTTRSTSTMAYYYFNYAVNIGTNASQSFSIGTMVSGYYTRNVATENGTTIVKRP